MLSYIEKAREKSPQEKRRIAFSIALIVTTIILVAWAVSFKTMVELSNKESVETENSVSPIEQMKNQFGIVLKGVDKLFDGPNN